MLWWRRRPSLPRVSWEQVRQDEPAGDVPFFGGSSRPYTRWWWLVGPFRQEDIVYQLDWLKAQGFGGVELAWLWPSWIGTGHPPTPLPEWLGREWSGLTAFAKRYAERVGLGCDFTFGSCWPFGGNHVPEEHAARTFDGLSGQRLHGSWEDQDPGPLFVLNHFRRAALEHYASCLLPAFADALRGRRSALFCDSLELDMRDAWSPELWEPFAARHGYRLEPFRLSLAHEAGARYDYHKFLAETMLREFFGAFADVCRSAGAWSRVQCHGSLSDLLAAYASVDIPESEALLFPPWFSRIPASAAALAGRPVVSCETFTCLYGFIHARDYRPLQYWRRENVADLKLLADALFAQGVNQVVWHGMPFNGPGGKAEFYASVHVGPDAAFAGHLPAFNAYLERVSAFLRLGRPLSRLAVYLPLEDSWVSPDLPPEERVPGAARRWELRHAVVPPETEGYAPLWVSYTFLRSAAVRDGRLVVGATEFDALYVDCEWMDGAALEDVLRLARAGLRVVWKRDPGAPGHRPRDDYARMLAELTSLPNVRANLGDLGLTPLVAGKALPWFWARQTGRHVYLFLAHPAARDVRYPLRFGQSAEARRTERELTLHAGPAPTTVRVVFEPYQSVLLRQRRDDGTVERIDVDYRPPPPVTDP